jgi:hypothetical protein
VATIRIASLTQDITFNANKTITSGTGTVNISAGGSVSIGN